MRALLALLLCLPGFAQDLAFSKAGRGPGLVLIHGFAGNRSVWEGFDAAFTDRRTVLAVDLPGCGASAAMETIDFDDLADRVAACMKAQGLERSALVAHSMGGLVALRVAAKYPDQVTGLVLIDTPLLPLGASQAEALAKAFEADPLATFRARYGAFAKDDAQREHIVLDASHISGKVLAAYTRARTVANEGVVAKVKCPVLLLASPILIPDPQAQNERLKEAGYGAFRELQPIRFPDVRHWIMWDEPKLTKRAVHEFLGHLEKR
jgi:pimeloyl-ACP methyl ester carboxylesterase